MRRSERQVGDIAGITGIIENCQVCRIAMTDGDAPYIVPMNFGYEISDAGLILYFHSAKEGRKIDILKKNPIVAFEIDNNNGLKDDGDTACNYSFYYESIIGTGKAEFVTVFLDKKAALEKIMKHQTKREGFLFDEKMIGLTTILKIISDNYTAKKLY